MTDLSNQRMGSVPLRKQLADSFGTYLHLVRLLLQAKSHQGDRSRTAVLFDGTKVSLSQLFDLDGTTLLVPREDGTIRRIPASQILRIEDKQNWGYV